MRSLIGARIRERRRALGLTQAGLAQQVDISASYLNLIEANKRSIGGALLHRLADALGLALAEVDGAAERRLLADLAELAGEPLLAELQLDAAAAGELAAKHTGWARALVRLQRALLDRDRAVSALSDRLRQDPFLGDAVHRMLTQVAAIRSAAEILETVEDLGPERRKRFIGLLGDDSRQLADVAQALAAFFDQAHTATRSTTPVEEVDDFLLDHGNHFPSLEDAAAVLRARIGGDAGEASIAAHLQRAGLPLPALPAGAPACTRRFVLARAAAQDAQDAQTQAAVDALLAASTLLSTPAAQRRARRVLASYLAAAMLLPYDEFRAAALARRYDIERLAREFDASFEQVCHRLVTLRRPGAEGVAFAFIRVDTAGFVTKRFALPQLALPRHGNACPMWAVYAAFQSPGAVVCQHAAFPAGDRFLFIARTVDKPRADGVAPRRLLSVMLACDALYADQLVYGDGLDLRSQAPAAAVGTNCRLCVRQDCLYREEDPVIDAGGGTLTLGARSPAR